VNSFLTLFDLIGQLARRRYQTAEQYFSALGLNHTEARLLTLLRQQNGAAAQDELSSRLTVDRSNAGRALHRLELDSYIRRRKDRADRRANFVELTPKGRKAAGEISKLGRKMALSFFGDLKEDEAAAIVALLSKRSEAESPAQSHSARSRARGPRRSFPRN